ncbi:DUF1839 family protein [Rhodococcus sp. IEGM 1379]|uniref:DUF1839 family protein n=1 Tax=Rhodococcus sp. IEGM 1379 TaxID=3047086 RepID=UPI0024B67FED|nr:DUF1839 family protein [Rhodococcus sp. IEGM 1379]MDI9917087.1 DUF1839 family protein [Rhodococcus sp. IEGM 1379]
MARLLDVVPDGYSSHAIHRDDRVWAQTNCYLDLWIEVLHSLELDPVPALACAFSSRFDGTQWTFLKLKAEDIVALYGIDVAEMNVWRAPLVHIEDNLAAGMLSTVEVDGYWLPDTLGTSYHEAHTKTTIVPNRIDRVAGELEYFHNSGYHVLRGEDFSGVFDLDRSSLPSFVPYVEQIRLSPGYAMNAGNVADVARRNVAVRPPGNPVRELGRRVVEDSEWVQAAGMDAFHLWSFGLLRQCGASAELAGDVSEFLDTAGFSGTVEAAEGFRKVAAGAKSVQFQMARAARGRAVDPRDQLDEMAVSWKNSMEIITAIVGVESQRHLRLV